MPAAHSWPDGQVFVTLGLVELLNDEELAAAIGHELGHLLGDGQLQQRGGVASLRGCRGCREGFGAEADADARGADLLTAAGLHPRAMSSMLRKVCDAGDLDPSCVAAIERRIRLIELIEPQNLPDPAGGRLARSKTGSPPQSP